jgi:lipopolysaccharide transport system permease protein
VNNVSKQTRQTIKSINKPDPVAFPGKCPSFVVTALGVGLWLGALNVQYRDVQYLVPFLIQVWMFATPVVYPSSLIPEQWRLIYVLNPMVGVVEGFRWVLLGQGTLLRPMLAVSVLVTIMLLVSGAFYFRRMERMFADII